MLLRKTKNNIKLICVIATIFVVYSLFEINIFLQDLNKIKLETNSHGQMLLKILKTSSNNNNYLENFQKIMEAKEILILEKDEITKIKKNIFEQINIFQIPNENRYIVLKKDLKYFHLKRSSLYLFDIPA